MPRRTAQAETVSREDFVRKPVTCRFCRVEYDAMSYTGEVTLPLHRHDGNTCEGSGQPIETAAVGQQRELILDPELGNSVLPNFYERDGKDEFGF